MAVCLTIATVPHVVKVRKVGLCSDCISQGKVQHAAASLITTVSNDRDKSQSTTQWTRTAHPCSRSPEITSFYIINMVASNPISVLVLFISFKSNLFLYVHSHTNSMRPYIWRSHLTPSVFIIEIKKRHGVYSYTA